MAATSKEKESLSILEALLADNEQILKNALEAYERARPIVISLKNAIAASKAKRCQRRGFGSSFNPPEIVTENVVNLGSSGLAIQPLPGRPSWPT